jgi:hypothetical protein
MATRIALAVARRRMRRPSCPAISPLLESPGDLDSPAIPCDRAAGYEDRNSARSMSSLRVKRKPRPCSHFAPIPSQNWTKHEPKRRRNGQRETDRSPTRFPPDQRVTGHGRLALITQRSLVQIQPPQPRQVAEIKGDDGQSAPLVFSADYEVLRPFRARAAAQRRLSSNVFALWRAFPRSPRAGLLSPDFIGTIGARNRLQWRGLASAPWVARHFGSATQGSGWSRCSKVQTGA